MPDMVQQLSEVLGRQRQRWKQQGQGEQPGFSVAYNHTTISLYFNVYFLLYEPHHMGATPAEIALKTGDLATGFGAPEMVATGAGTAFTVTITGVYTREKWSFWSMYSSIRHSLLISMELVNTTPAGIALKPGDLATGFGAPEMVVSGARRQPGFQCL